MLPLHLEANHHNKKELRKAIQDHKVQANLIAEVTVRGGDQDHVASKKEERERLLHPGGQGHIRKGEEGTRELTRGMPCEGARRRDQGERDYLWVG